jgi:hypothetical protein
VTFISGLNTKVKIRDVTVAMYFSIQSMTIHLVAALNLSEIRLDLLRERLVKKLRRKSRKKSSYLTHNLMWKKLSELS